MKKYLFFLLLTGLVVGPATGQDLPPQAFLEKMKTLPAFTVLDIRTPAETAATGTLPGAVVLDFNAADFSEKISRLDKNRPVLVYCAVGGRSGKTVQLLEKQGFKTAFNLEGGIRAWLAAGLPVVKRPD